MDMTQAEATGHPQIMDRCPPETIEGKESAAGQLFHASSCSLLDLFCGAGGAGEGYQRAGFDVTGVDIKPMLNNPHRFIRGDALEYLEAHGHEYDAIHASPPCQRYSTATREAEKHPDLYVKTRDILSGFDAPWVIENVIGAPYSHGVKLCGTMFGLDEDGEWIQRHRNFETSWLMFQPECNHLKTQRAITITGHCFLTVTKDCARHSRQGSFDLCQRLMGIDWMSRKELVQAIPPAYTEFIGRDLMRILKAKRRQSSTQATMTRAPRIDYERLKQRRG